MPRTWGEWRRAVIAAFVGAILTAIVQGFTFATSVRDDLRDLKHDMAELRCTVAVFTRAATLPQGCNPNKP